MAYESPLFSVPGLEADADLSTKQFYCVATTATANKRVNVASADGQPIIGILQNKPSAQGDAAQVLALGVTKVVAGGTLAAGDLWGTGSDGRALAKAATHTGADVGDYIAGMVLEGAAAGELATVTIGFPAFQVSY